MGNTPVFFISAIAPTIPLVTGSFGGCEATNPKNPQFGYIARLDDYDGCSGKATIFIDILEPSDDNWNICDKQDPSKCNENPLHHFNQPPLSVQSFPNNYNSGRATVGFLFDGLTFINGQAVNIKSSLTGQQMHFDDPSVTTNLVINFELTHAAKMKGRISPALRSRIRKKITDSLTRSYR